MSRRRRTSRPQGPPAKKRKTQDQPVASATPSALPVLPPEVWARVFQHLPSKDLVNVCASGRAFYPEAARVLWRGPRLDLGSFPVPQAMLRSLSNRGTLQHLRSIYLAVPRQLEAQRAFRALLAVLPVPGIITFAFTTSSYLTAESMDCYLAYLSRNTNITTAVIPYIWNPSEVVNNRLETSICFRCVSGRAHPREIFFLDKNDQSTIRRILGSSPVLLELDIWGIQNRLVGQLPGLYCPVVDELFKHLGNVHTMRLSGIRLNMDYEWFSDGATPPTRLQELHLRDCRGVVTALEFLPFLRPIKLQTLVIEDNSGVVENKDTLCAILRPFSQLQELSLQLDLGDDFLDRDQQNLRTLLQAHPELEKLVLRFGRYPMYDTDIAEVLSLAPNLTHLAVTNPLPEESPMFEGWIKAHWSEAMASMGKRLANSNVSHLHMFFWAYHEMKPVQPVGSERDRHKIIAQRMYDELGGVQSTNVTHISMSLRKPLTNIGAKLGRTKTFVLGCDGKAVQEDVGDWTSFGGYRWSKECMVDRFGPFWG